MTGPSPAVPMPGPGPRPGPPSASPAGPIGESATPAPLAAAPHPGEAIAAATQELLRDVDAKPVGERIEVFAAVHERLQRALTQIDAPGQ